MTDYKLVPVEPTQEMVEAARQHHEGEAYLPVSLYKAMLAAAPAVQGEPVGYIRKSAIELMKNDELGVRANIIKEPRYRDCVAIYTAPNPAEQQPDRDVRMLAASLYQACGAYDMPTRVLDALSAAANGEPFAHMIDGLLPCVPPSNQDVQGDPVGADQQPDVTQLVEALESSQHGLHDSIDGEECRCSQCKFVRLRDNALADYRKGGGQ